MISNSGLTLAPLLALPRLSAVEVREAKAAAAPCAVRIVGMCVAHQEERRRAPLGGEGLRFPLTARRRAGVESADGDADAGMPLASASLTFLDLARDSRPSPVALLPSGVDGREERRSIDMRGELVPRRTPGRSKRAL